MHTPFAKLINSGYAAQPFVRHAHMPKQLHATDGSLAVHDVDNCITLAGLHIQMDNGLRAPYIMRRLAAQRLTSAGGHDMDPREKFQSL